MTTLVLEKLAELPVDLENKFCVMDIEIYMIIVRLEDYVQDFNDYSMWILTPEQADLYKTQIGNIASKQFSYTVDPITFTLSISPVHDTAERSAMAAATYNVEELLLTSELQTTLTTLTLLQASNIGDYVKNLELARIVKVGNNLQCRGLIHAAHVAFMHGLGVGKFSNKQAHHRADEVAKIFVAAYFTMERVKDYFGIYFDQCAYAVDLSTLGIYSPSTNFLIEQQKKLKSAVDLVSAQASNWLEGVDLQAELEQEDLGFGVEEVELVSITDELTTTINAAIIANDPTLTPTPTPTP